MNYWTQSPKNIYVAAHRGWRTKYPENTMESFRAAEALGVDQLELDVRVTKDDELVVIHDPTVDRTTDGTGLVREKTLAELKALDAGIFKGEEFRGCKIPTFIEFMEFIKDHPTMTLDVELKERPSEIEESRSYELCDRVLNIIDDYGFTDRVVINTWSGKLHEYIYKKYGKKYRLHSYYPKSCLGEIELEPYAFPYCCCMFAQEEGLRNKAVPMATKQEFDINGALQQGVSIDLSSVATITDFEIQNTKAASVRAAESGNILLKDGTIDGATGYSVHVDNNNTNTVTLEGVTITNSGTYGLANVDKGPVVAKDVTIVDSGSAAIQLGNGSTITTDTVTISGGTQGIEANGGILAKAEDAETGVTISDVTEYGIYNKSNTSTVQDVKISSGENGIGCLTGTLNAKNIDVKVTTSGIHMIDGTVKTDAVTITGGTAGITGVAGTVESATESVYGVTVSGVNYGIDNASGTFTVKGVDITGGTYGVRNTGGQLMVGNTQIANSGVNGIRSTSGTLNLDNVTVKNITKSAGDAHGVMIMGGTVNISAVNDSTNGLVVNNTTGHGIAITKGTLLGGPVSVTNGSRYGVYATSGIDITDVVINNCKIAVGVKNATVKINGVSKTVGNTTTSYNMSDFTSN